MFCYAAAPVMCNSQLCCHQAIRHRNLVGVIDILQVNTPIRHPADFQLAVSPECCFGRQVPLPTAGLLRARVESLVWRAAQSGSKYTPRGRADILVTRIIAGKIVSGRLNKRSGSVQGPNSASTDTKRRIVGTHADGQQAVTGLELAHSRADCEPSRAKYLPR